VAQIPPKRLMFRHLVLGKGVCFDLEIALAPGLRLLTCGHESKKEQPERTHFGAASGHGCRAGQRVLRNEFSGAFGS
jgi:hypothetical protein